MLVARVEATSNCPCLCEGGRRLHTNTAYGHVWASSGLSAEHRPPRVSGVLSGVLFLSGVLSGVLFLSGVFFGCFQVLSDVQVLSVRVQVLRCSRVQVFRCSSVHMFSQVLRCSSDEVFK